ncbi:MAG: pantoate--beta-alanine ligase, partial [Planctomycetota bacterium]
MIQLDDVSAARSTVQRWRIKGETVGIVPTMGALHDGHLSLVRRSMEICDRTIATIFVNPTQFGPREDLARYPRTLGTDLGHLRSIGTDAVFLPSVETIYPPDFSTSVRCPDVGARWEGAFRPTHFDGVATVVLKLFNILPSSHAFFGRKDYQQLKVIEAVVRD